MHGGGDKMVTILQTGFTSSFSLKKILYLIRISVKYVLKVPVDNEPARVWIMAQCWIGNKQSSKPKVTLDMCLTWPWVKNSCMNYIWNIEVAVKLTSCGCHKKNNPVTVIGGGCSRVSYLPDNMQYSAVINLFFLPVYFCQDSWLSFSSYGRKLTIL